MTEDYSEGGTSIMMVRHKVVFVGDVNVGKTSVMNRFIENKFKDSYDPTIGVDFFSKTITIFKENTLKLQIWDSAGQERYKSLIPSYVRGASIIFILYDVSSTHQIILGKESFENVPNWINFIKSVKVDYALVVLCGNKTDLDRQVATADGQKLATKENLHFYEVSAKTSENIFTMFYSSIAELPFFEQFEVSNKQELVDQLSTTLLTLVRENQYDVDENSILNIVRNTTKKGIDVKGSKNNGINKDTDTKQNCKC